MPQFILVVRSEMEFPFRIYRNWIDSFPTLVAEYKSLDEAFIKLAELSPDSSLTIAGIGSLNSEGT